METIQKRINIYCQPYGFDKSNHAIEKDNSSGVKGRYLRGVASGSNVDGTGERITQKAVQSMMDQAKTGEILLYADRHNVMHSNDIGRLVNQELLPNGDWLVEFKLYEPSDGMGHNTDETVNKCWKQLKGLPPYTRARQRGFSIEGFIPDDGILSMQDDGSMRVIDDVQLDGVVLVTRPAYETSIASAVYKALDEKMPHQVRKDMESSLKTAMEREAEADNFYKQKYRLEDAMRAELEKIMKAGADQFALETLFEEYSRMMVDFLIQNKGMFIEDESNTDSVEEVETLYNGSKNAPVAVAKSKLAIYKDLYGQLDRLSKKLY